MFWSLRDSECTVSSECAGNASRTWGGYVNPLFECSKKLGFPFGFSLSLPVKLKLLMFKESSLTLEKLSWGGFSLQGAFRDHLWV